MAVIYAWGVAAVLYAVFLGWYVNWRGPLGRDETNTLMMRIGQGGAGADGRNDLDAMRSFLEADDGREFFMLNLVRIAPGDVADPVTGAMTPARDMLRRYTSVFLRALFMRGGHPAVVARKVGPYFDAWGVEADPGWSIVGYMRYRCRRDLAELVADPRFSGAHDFKFAATPQTLSFPSQPMMLTMASPQLWVGLVLVLGAAAAHIIILSV